jgi:hypothetical protein
MNKKKVINVLSGTFLAVLFTCLSSWGAEVRYPIPCYEGEELAKVREWEKNWVGKTFNEKTLKELEGIKEFFTENYYKVLTSPDRFGPWEFAITPYVQLMPTAGDIALTKQYGGMAKVEGENLVNYTSGVPFSQPQTALEIMYNYDNMDWGDQWLSRQDMFLIDGVRKYDRRLLCDTWALYFSCRRSIPPVPALTPNTKDIYRALHSVYLEPASYQGTRGLSIKWNDRKRDWGYWAFASSTRRLYRSSTAQRQDTAGGADASYDDEFGYNWNIPAQTYKSLGRKEMLLVRHSDKEVLLKGHTEGNLLLKNLGRERVNVYVIEATNKDPNYLYGKQLYYIDPETWFMLYFEKWDKKGQLWKTMDVMLTTVKSKYNGEMVPQASLLYYLDVQRLHATFVVNYLTIGDTGKYYVPDFYEPRALMRQGY